MLGGVIPMALALGVSNALIDEGGIEPGESEIIDVWEAWAFSPRFVSLTLFGLAMLSTLCWFVPSHYQICYVVAVLSIIGICLFAAMFIQGWFFSSKRLSSEPTTASASHCHKYIHHEL